MGIAQDTEVVGGDVAYEDGVGAAAPALIGRHSHPIRPRLFGGAYDEQARG